MAELPQEPGLGDVILDGNGHRWTILVVSKATLAARWRSETREVATRPGAGRHHLGAEDEAARPATMCAPTWQTWKTGARARIQPIDSKIVADAETPYTTTSYRIFVEQQLDLDHTGAIRGPDVRLQHHRRRAGAETAPGPANWQVIEAEIVVSGVGGGDVSASHMLALTTGD